MNKAGVPYGGIAITAAMTLLGVGLNAIVPEEAFEIVLNVASLGIIAAWATIVLCQMRLKQWADRGLLKRPSFRMIGAPFTSYLTLAFLAGVLVLIGFDYPVGTFTIGSLVIIIPLLVLGWFLCRAASPPSPGNAPPAPTATAYRRRSRRTRRIPPPAAEGRPAEPALRIAGVECATAVHGRGGTPRPGRCPSCGQSS